MVFLQQQIANIFVLEVHSVLNLAMWCIVGENFFQYLMWKSFDAPNFACNNKFHIQGSTYILFVPLGLSPLMFACCYIDNFFITLVHKFLNVFVRTY